MNHALRGRNGRWAAGVRRYRAALGLAAVVLLLWAGTAVAAEVAGGETYRLPRGEVVTDDLYVTGGEVIIDGTVNGDLVVAGGYLEINGVVTGDLIAAGGAVVLNGTVQDDARLAGGGIVVAGSVGDDLFVAGGGGPPGWPIFPVTMGDRSVPQGIQLMPQTAVAGDAYVAGGQGTLSGSVGGDLWVGMGLATFNGRVAGDASLSAATLTVGDAAQVQGTLTVASERQVALPDGVAAAVSVEALPEPETATPARSPLVSALWWLLRTALILLGLSLLGWIVWALAPRVLTEPVGVMEERPLVAILYGLLAAIAVLPVSAALVFLAVVFWNWFPGGLVMLTFTFGLASLVWLVSPVVSGLWLGGVVTDALGMTRGGLTTLLIGIATIVIGGRILGLVPCVGGLAFWGIYLLSFALAVGSWLLARSRGPALVAEA